MCLLALQCVLTRALCSGCIGLFRRYMWLFFRYIGLFSQKKHIYLQKNHNLFAKEPWIWSALSVVDGPDVMCTLDLGQFSIKYEFLAEKSPVYPQKSPTNPLYSGLYGPDVMCTLDLGQFSKNMGFLRKRVLHICKRALQIRSIVDCMLLMKWVPSRSRAIFKKYSFCVEKSLVYPQKSPTNPLWSGLYAPHEMSTLEI